MSVKSKNRSLKLRYPLAAVLLLAVALVAAWLVIVKLENEPPTFALDRPLESIGADYALRGVASDEGSGLRRIQIALLQRGRELTLAEQTFPVADFFSGDGTAKHNIDIPIRAREHKVEDGDAVLRIAIWDQSYRNWGEGNRYYKEYPFSIDTAPPGIEVLTRSHNINQGGAGVAAYRVTEPIAESGIQIGDRFFPGSAGLIKKDSAIFVAFFALPYDKGPETEILLKAVDQAGNISHSGLPYHIRAKTFKKDSLDVPESFLKRKMPEFQAALGARYSTEPGALVQNFLAVNRDLRQANHATLLEVCNRSDGEIHWSGPFLRLPGSAQRSGFADQRMYRYESRDIDEQVHLGIDLASLAQSPVPVGNNGRIAFSGDLGIYGKTVVVDHGLGLFSMYAHLSRIQAVNDQKVAKGDVIGVTGSTGLAGGDHLHLSIFVRDTMVNPVEWWDPNWIRHNVTDKLEQLEAPE